MRRLLIILAVALASVTLFGGGSVIARDNKNNDEDLHAHPTIHIVGAFVFVPNVVVMGTTVFAPDTVHVDSGNTLAVNDIDKVTEPHTVTIVEQDELPSPDENPVPDLEEVLFECEPCQEALAAHLGLDNGPPPEEGEEEVQDPVVNEGEEGLDTPGDSVFIDDGETVKIEVSAEPGTTLYYLCAIHPWMQGAIEVN